MTKPSQPDTDSSTPIPWHWEVVNGSWALVSSKKSVLVASLDFNQKPRMIAMGGWPDADFIVRAVNNHAKLLKALKRILGESHNPVVERIAQDAIEAAQS